MSAAFLSPDIGEREVTELDVLKLEHFVEMKERVCDS